MLRFIGGCLILAGIPLLLVGCFPGLICMGVGCLFLIAGRPEKVVVIQDGNVVSQTQEPRTSWGLLFIIALIVGVLCLLANSSKLDPRNDIPLPDRSTVQPVPGK